MAKIVLASQSPYRKKQMEDFGLVFATFSPNIDEKAVQEKIKSPTKLALALSKQKALKGKEQHPGCIIIGSDQLVALDRTVFGKPGTKEAARSQLRRMSGRTHRLITAVTVLYKDRELSNIVTAKIKIRKLTENEISIYVDRDKPLDCAGSYRFESGAYSLIESLDVEDPSALMGLPMITLGKLLRKITRSQNLIEFSA